MQKDFTLLNKFIDQKQLFNGNILVANYTQVLNCHSFGSCFDPLEDKELDNNSVFELASVSKQFTALATLLVFKQHNIPLDIHVEEILTDFPYKGIKVRNLLNHTAGLPDYISLFKKHWDKTTIATNEDVLQMLLEFKPDIHFGAEEKWEYSNTGYVLLALILEGVSHSKFEHILRQHIFKPLGMEKTCVYNRRRQPMRIENYAFGVIKNWENQQFELPEKIKGYEYVYYLDGIQGDGTIQSTVNDLLIWNNAILNKELLNEEEYNQMFQVTKTKHGESIGYGFGWVIEHDPQVGKVVFHGGSWPGYSTYNSIYLDYGISIISLCNKPYEIEIEQQLILALENITFRKPFEFPILKKAI